MVRTTGGRNWSWLQIEDFQDCSYSEEDVQATGKFRAVSDGIELASIIGTREFGGLGASLAVVNLTVGNKGKYQKSLKVGGVLEEVLVVGEPAAESDDGGREQAGRVGIFLFFVFLFFVCWLRQRVGRQRKGDL